MSPRTPCPLGSMRSSPPAWTRCPPPTRRCSTTRPCSARSAGWARWPRSPAATCPTWRPRSTAWRPASSSSGRPTRGWPARSSTRSATPWSATSYGQVLRAERADKHRRAAAWIEGLAPDRRGAGRAARLPLPGRPVVRPGRRDRAAGTGRPRPGALRDAGDQAAALGGWETAARFHAEALELSPRATRPAASSCCALAGPAAGRDGRPRRADRGPRGPAGRRRPGGRRQAEMLLGELAFLQGRGEDRESHHDQALALVAGAPPSPARRPCSGAR